MLRFGLERLGVQRELCIGRLSNVATQARAVGEWQPRPQLRKVQHLHATGGQRACKQVALLGR